MDRRKFIFSSLGFAGTVRFQLAQLGSKTLGIEDGIHALATPKRGIALTYANDLVMDGAGAQLQRIYGIYAASRALGLPYVHSPLLKIGYQGLVSLEANSYIPGLEESYNRIFTIPSDIKLPKDVTTQFIEAPSSKDLEDLENKAIKDDAFILVRIVMPYKITDWNPAVYDCLKGISPFRRSEGGPFRVAIHVRRGELHVVDQQRMLPNSYYIAATKRIVSALGAKGVPFACDLYTETPSETLRVTSHSPGLKGRVKNVVTIDPSVDQLEDFKVLPNLSMHINGDPIDAMRGMATADALIISQSSFSYLPALFNDGIIVYHPFWHRALKGWLVTDDAGSFSDSALDEHLNSWLATSRGRALQNLRRDK